jgi:hypothetical protein
MELPRSEPHDVNAQIVKNAEHIAKIFFI